MSANTVIRKIEEKTQAQIDEILKNAEAKAEEIRSSVLAEATARAQELAEKANATADMLMRASTQQAMLDNKIDSLNHRHDLLIDAKEAAKQALLSLSDADFCKLMAKQIAQNATVSEMTLRVSKNDLGKYTDKAFCQAAIGFNGTFLAYCETAAANAQGKPVRLTLDKNGVDIAGGAILCSPVYDVDLSFDAMLDEVFAENEKAIADCLFAENGVEL